MGYDRAIVVFSPDGRLLQVEYARQMVKNGSTAVGITLSNAVLIGAVKMRMPLAVADSYKKIYAIDDHVGFAWAGSFADARELLDMARVKSQVNRITFGESISVTSITKHVCDRKHMVTQYAGVRPYGVGLLIGGVDKNGSKLFETEPSGTMIEWKAQAIGKGAEKAKKILNQSYKESMSVENGVKLLLKAVKAGEKSVKNDDIEIVSIKKDGISKVSIGKSK
jgi:proteasome alpha subunit